MYSARSLRTVIQLHAEQQGAQLPDGERGGAVRVEGGPERGEARHVDGGCADVVLDGVVLEDDRHKDRE